MLCQGNCLGRPRKSKALTLSVVPPGIEKNSSSSYLNCFILLYSIDSVSSTSIYQAIHDAHLDNRLEEILLKLLEHNSSPNAQEPIRQFLSNYELMNENFWSSYKKANTIEDALERYYQFTKNQCILVETLMVNLRFSIDKDNSRKDLAAMLKDGFTF